MKPQLSLDNPSIKRPATRKAYIEGINHLREQAYNAGFVDGKTSAHNELKGQFHLQSAIIAIEKVCESQTQLAMTLTKLIERYSQITR